MSAFKRDLSQEMQDAAASWLARRDRGLTAAEQDAYLQWLRENPQHGATITRLEKVWGVLDHLSDWRPKHSPQPNPDLLAPKRRGRLYWLSTAACAAAAAVALLLWSNQSKPETPARQAIIHPGAERMVLEDGSIVELNAGAKVAVNFTPGERRVQLVSGEAFFTVAKNKERPFIVSANQIDVRAVGTAFSVSLGQRAVSVLVTEGKVQVDETAPDGAVTPSSPLVGDMGGSGSYLTAGQQATITLAPDTPAVAAVQDVTPAQVERSLSWQGLRLEFPEMPLLDVATEFNRYNRQKLVVADPTAGMLVIGGTFRADNLEGFVRLLETSFDVKAETRGDEIVLRKAP
jgi:transmembrane sensor